MDYVRDRKFIPPTCLRLAKTLRIDFAEAMSANLRREMTEIAAHAQNLGAEASARVATMMGEFASNMASPGLATVRGAGARMALLASGLLAGIADALSDQAEAKKTK